MTTVIRWEDQGAMAVQAQVLRDWRSSVAGIRTAVVYGAVSAEDGLYISPSPVSQMSITALTGRCGPLACTRTWLTRASGHSYGRSSTTTSSCRPCTALSATTGGRRVCWTTCAGHAAAAVSPPRPSRLTRPCAYDRCPPRRSNRVTSALPVMCRSSSATAHRFRPRCRRSNGPGSTVPRARP